MDLRIKNGDFPELFLVYQRIQRVKENETNIFHFQPFSCQVAFVPAAAVRVPQQRREVQARGA